MTKKAEFNAEEWARVVEGPMLAGARVATAHRGGTIRETIAMGKVYAEARKQQGESELLDELVSQPPAIDAERFKSGGDVGPLVEAGLREGMQLVEQKATPEEAESYRGFVLAVAEAAARAHKEGGFLGIGGEQVSEAEQAALDEIAATLRSSPN